MNFVFLLIILIIELIFFLPYTFYFDVRKILVY
jgi:hypothetical protein